MSCRIPLRHVVIGPTVNDAAALLHVDLAFYWGGGPCIALRWIAVITLVVTPNTGDGGDDKRCTRGRVVLGNPE